jgi:hypothetical protein
LNKGAARLGGYDANIEADDEALACRPEMPYLLTARSEECGSRSFPTLTVAAHASVRETLARFVAK